MTSHQTLIHRNGWRIPIQTIEDDGRGMKKVRVYVGDLPDDLRQTVIDRQYPDLRNMFVLGEGPVPPRAIKEVEDARLSLRLSREAIDAIV